MSHNIHNLPNLYQLSDAEFIRRVLEDSVPLMKPGAHISDYDLEPKKQFIVQSGYYTGQILNQIERIDQAGILMNSYPKIHAWRTRYGRFEYSQYHMEQYFIAFSGLVDRLLLLINHLYQLGFDDEEVRFGKVVKSLRKQNQNRLIEILNNLQTSTHEIKIKKNSYTHSVRFWEKRLWHIGLREYALKNNIIDDEDGLLKEDLKFDIQLFRQEKMKLIIDNEKALIELMRLICTELYKQYLSQLST